MLHHARCVAAEQSSPSYLVLGMFKTSAQHPGFPDKRCVTLADLKASEIPVATIKEKLDEFEAAATAPSATTQRGPRRATAPCLYELICLYARVCWRIVIDVCYQYYRYYQNYRFTRATTRPPRYRVIPGLPLWLRSQEQISLKC